MKTDFSSIERYRERSGFYGTAKGITFGKFVIDVSDTVQLMCIVDDGEISGWEHVSVSAWAVNYKGDVQPRIPTWEEMAAVKDHFWLPEEAAMQLHPPASDYVNHNANVLHVWKPKNAEIPLPPSVLVGPPTSIKTA